MVAPRDLTRAMLAFGGLLRASGLPVTTSAVMDAVRALEAVDLMDRGEVYLTLRTVLMSRIEEQPAFDRCFEAFWKFHADEGQGLDGLIAAAQPLGQEEQPEAGAIEAAREKQAQVALDDWDQAEAADDEPLEVPGLSDREALMEQDFSTFPAEQLDEVARLTVQIAKRLARRVSRRRKPTRRGGVIDLRRSMRANLMKGEIIELRRRSRRRRKVRLVLLCDVSGSMDLYSRFLLQFLYALQNVFGRVETFTFATRLTRVSDLLRGPSYKGALRRLTEVRDWSGGTRIGESIREFNQTWGRLVDRRTIVVLLSDGWDTGEPDVLAQEMLTLKRRAARLIWLNPLLGNPSYEPLTRGMAAALPLVDHFAAAHNLASLRELAGHLNVR
jgi:uncharacterized protein with von Willebrand factor type A (vWA) domain